jgi:hypothetical protein
LRRTITDVQLKIFDTIFITLVKGTSKEYLLQEQEVPSKEKICP